MDNRITRMGLNQPKNGSYNLHTITWENNPNFSRLCRGRQRSEYIFKQYPLYIFLMKRFTSLFRQGVTAFEQTTSTTSPSVFEGLNGRLQQWRGWASAAKGQPTPAKSSSGSNASAIQAASANIPAPAFSLKAFPIRKRSVVVPTLHSPNAHVPMTLRKKIDVERRDLVSKYEVRESGFEPLVSRSVSGSANPPLVCPHHLSDM